MYINIEELREQAKYIALNELLKNEMIFRLTDIFEETLSEDSTFEINDFFDFLEESFLLGIDFVVEHNFTGNIFSTKQIDEESLKIITGIFGLSVYANIMSEKYKYNGIFGAEDLTFKIALLSSNIGMIWCYSHIKESNPAY